MKVTRFLLSVLLLGVTATISSAQGVVNLSWQTCTGPVDRAVLAGSTGNKVIASVLGQSAPHQAYQVNVVYGSQGGLRDAWRFDAGGCNDGFMTATHVDAIVNKTCPGFQGGEGLQIKKWTYDPLTGKTLAIFANAYAQTPALSPVPTTRYFLCEWNFDHTFSVVGPSDPGATCGGLEVAVCAAIQQATWLDMSGAEIPWTIGQSFMTSNDPNHTSGCPGPVPVQSKTWGSLKSQYRN